MHEKFAKKGLVVIMLSSESDAKVQSYPTDNKISFIVATTPKKTFEDYNITGYPSSYLIDGNGRVVWEGHPMLLEESQVEEVMKTVTWIGLPDVPRSLLSAKTSFMAKKYGAASKKARSKLDSKSSSPEEKAAAEMILEKINEASEKRMSSLEVALEEGRYPEVFKGLDFIQSQFAGLEVAKRAREREAELKKDAGIKEEMKAFKILDKYLVALSRARSAAEKKRYIPALEALVKKFGGYYASREAEGIIVDLKALR